MIPILYGPEETAFDSNGIGLLTDAVDCIVEQQLNGQYELEMEYPVTGMYFANLQQRALILSDVDPVSSSQPFRIYRITKPHKGVVTAYARHIAYDLQGIPVSPFSAPSAAAALQGLKNNAVTPCPFEFWTDKATSANMSIGAPMAIWSQLGGTRGSVLDVYGGEYEFDRFKVKLHGRLGSDRGVSIRYGKNLSSLEQDENCSNCFTGVYPYWIKDGEPLVQLPEKIVKAPGEYDYTKILPLDLSQEWDTAPTEDQLRARAERYINDNDIGTPDVSMKVEFVQLEQCEEYRGMALLERVLLGDTVTVEFPLLKVSATARAVAVKYKPLLDRYDQITIGKVRSDLASTIASQQKELERKPDVTTIKSMADAAAKTILGAKGGCVRMLDTDGDGQPDTLYIADNPDPNQAVKVWRHNYEGWAASKNGYNGPFTMAATLEHGMMADFVTAAKLVAGTIQSADGESFFIDLDNGIMRLNSKMTTVDGEQIATKSDLEKGVDHVITKTGYEFGANGLDVTKPGSEMSTRITEDGMRVFRDNQVVLNANNTGVDAENLRATTYLIVGGRSRFENYGEDRTGCFWIGG